MCKKSEFAYVWLDKKLVPIDRCIAPLILQLNLVGIKTLNSCCGHGKGYPCVICAPGTKEMLKEFGCQIVVERKDGKIIAYFPANSFSGKTYSRAVDEGYIEEEC